MVNDSPREWPLVMNEKLAALYTGVSVSFLQKARSQGRTKGQCEGPKFFRLGRKIMYRKIDLDEWVATRKTQVTI